MGIKFTVDNKYDFQVLTYSLSEDSTPLAAGDTTGGTGFLSLTLALPDRSLVPLPEKASGWISEFGPNILLQKPISFTDPRWGTVTGTIEAISQPDAATIRVNAVTSMNQLNAYNVTAGPRSTTLGPLLRYYVGLAGAGLSTSVASALSTRPISAQGWTGELWYHLKMLAVAEEFDISLVNGTIRFQPLRQRGVPTVFNQSRSGDTPTPMLAQSVEAYQYSNVGVTNAPVYPPGGWTPEVQVLNVNAGEEAEYTLDLSASVSSIETPVMQTFVAADYTAGSVYTVVANDGLPVPPALWRSRGGSVDVSIGPLSTQLTVKLRGAVGIPLSTGGVASLFSLALASDTSGSNYSTLRIRGSGVAFTPKLRRFRTGVTPQQSGTEVGVTIDNIFLGTKDQTYRAGTRAAVQFSGPVPGAVITTERPLDPGVTPTLGNVPGARMFDPITKRYYRSRAVTYSEGLVDIEFEDDTIHTDIQSFRTGQTYGAVQAGRGGATYRDDYLVGLR